MLLSSAMPVPIALHSVMLPRAVDVEQPGAAERGVGAEGHRVEEVVVDAAVDHVDALAGPGSCACRRSRPRRTGPGPRPVRRPSAGPGRRARSRRCCTCPGVSTTTVGSLTPAGATAAQRLQQQVRVVRHRRHAVQAEQLREQPHHHLAVLEHVAHAAGHAQVVLEHVVVRRCRRRSRRRARCRCRRCASRRRPARRRPTISGRYWALFSTCSAGTMPAFRISWSW